MNPRLKPLSEQVVVVTGASSGIGLATARMAAEEGVADVKPPATSPCAGESEREALGAEGQHAARIHRGKTLLGLAVLGAGLLAANRGRS